MPKIGARQQPALPGAAAGPAKETALPATQDKAWVPNASQLAHEPPGQITALDARVVEVLAPLGGPGDGTLAKELTGSRAELAFAQLQLGLSRLREDPALAPDICGRVLDFAASAQARQAGVVKFLARELADAMCGPHLTKVSFDAQKRIFFAAAAERSSAGCLPDAAYRLLMDGFAQRTTSPDFPGGNFEMPQDAAPLLALGPTASEVAVRLHSIGLQALAAVVAPRSGGDSEDAARMSRMRAQIHVTLCDLARTASNPRLQNAYRTGAALFGQTPPVPERRPSEPQSPEPKVQSPMTPPSLASAQESDSDDEHEGIRETRKNSSGRKPLSSSGSSGPLLSRTGSSFSVGASSTSWDTNAWFENEYQLSDDSKDRASSGSPETPAARTLRWSPVTPPTPSSSSRSDTPMPPPLERINSPPRQQTVTHPPRASSRSPVDSNMSRSDSPLPPPEPKASASSPQTLVMASTITLSKPPSKPPDPPARAQAKTRESKAQASPAQGVIAAPADPAERLASLLGAKTSVRTAYRALQWERLTPIDPKALVEALTQHAGAQPTREILAPAIWALPTSTPAQAEWRANFTRSLIENFQIELKQARHVTPGAALAGWLVQAHRTALSQLSIVDWDAIKILEKTTRQNCALLRKAIRRDDACTGAAVTEIARLHGPEEAPTGIALAPAKFQDLRKRNKASEAFGKSLRRQLERDPPRAWATLPPVAKGWRPK